MQLLSDVPKLQVMADRDLERNLYDLLSQLKQDRCQFVLCLENCYDQKIHELFKQIACGDLGKHAPFVSFQAYLLASTI